MPNNNDNRTPDNDGPMYRLGLFAGIVLIVLLAAIVVSLGVAALAAIWGWIL